MAGSWQGAETFPSFNPIKQRELLSRAWGCVSSRGGPRGGGAVVALEVGDFAAPRGRPRPRSVSAPPMAAAGRGGHRRPHTMAQTKADPICNSTRGRGPPRPAAAGTPAAVGSEGWGFGGGGLRASVSPEWGGGGGCVSRMGNSGLRPRERCGGRPGVGPPSPAAPRPAGSARPGPASPLKGTGSPRAGRGAPLSHRARDGGPRAAPLSPPDPFRAPENGSALLPGVPRPPDLPPSRCSRCSAALGAACRAPPVRPSLSQFVPVPPRPAPSRCGSGGSRSCVRGVPAGRACVHTCAMRVGRVRTCARAMCVGVRSCVCMYA